MIVKIQILRPDGNMVWEAIFNYQDFVLLFQGNFGEEGNLYFRGMHDSIKPPWILKIENLSEEAVEIS